MTLEADTSTTPEPRYFRDVLRGKVNTSHEAIYTNLRRNLRRQLPQMQWYPPNDYQVLLLCGGPSLAANERRVRAYARKGWKIATVNGTHAWALERGLKPSVHAMLDARAFNERFVTNPVDGCRYLICSQCDDAVFKALKGYDVHLWHGASPSDPEAKILDRFYRTRWQRVMGGSSIGTRALGLLYLMGVRTVRVFGQDTCLLDGAHHAFEQPENDESPERVRPVKVGRRRFYAHNWMLSQLDDWLQMASGVPDDLQLAIEGEGLLAYILGETARRGRPPRITLER